MIDPLAFAALFLVAVGALAIQHSYWARIVDAQDTIAQAHARDLDAEVVVETLTNDLAQAHRANTLLRTGILDAEREANEMAQVLALPIELSERRAR